MDNIIASKHYRPGSVGYVTKSGGMSNELNTILSLVTNGTYEGIAIALDLLSFTISFVTKMTPSARCCSFSVRLVVLKSTASLRPSKMGSFVNPSWLGPRCSQGVEGSWICGIGNLWRRKINSVNNPNLRVKLPKNMSTRTSQATVTLGVRKATTSKKDTAHSQR